ncbi:MAG TPA: hypothetical protein VFA42_08675 [Gaiellaceae bacterium]|nr:hypothetical protein [Gaiellaceae bacterium]
MRLALVVAAVLAFAAPAFADQPRPPQGQPLAPETVPGAGLSGVAGVRAARYRTVRATGVVAAGRFRLDFAAGPGAKLVLGSGNATVFRALRFTSMRWTANAVAMKGIGIASGQRVRFTALAVDGARHDVFRVDWRHRAALGGPLLQGAVVIH